MGDPVPLSAPDGTVMAWACGTCGVVAPSSGEPLYMPDDTQRSAFADNSRRNAEECCVCSECGAPAPRGDALFPFRRCAPCGEKMRAEWAVQPEIEPLFCVCGSRLDDDAMCDRCISAGRRAFEVLAAIGMAVAVHHYALDLHDCMTRPRGIDMCPATAALCGVSPETVRGWR